MPKQINVHCDTLDLARRYVLSACDAASQPQSIHRIVIAHIDEDDLLVLNDQL